MKRSKQKQMAAYCMKLAAEEADPEMREIMEDIAADYLAGRIKEPPRRKQDCKSFEDACRYIFKTAHLDPDNSMVVEGKCVVRMDWFGREFSDKQVGVLEEFLARGLNSAGFIELRLISTRVTAEGAERLRRVLPRSKVSVVLDGDDNPELDLPKFRTKPSEA
jgi:hypothetical protein